MFTLLHGGRIVESWKVKAGDYSGGYSWNAGQILTLDAEGYAKVADGSSTGPFGIALERRIQPVSSLDITNDETFSSKQVSVITGEALGITSDVVNGVTFAANDVLYNENGNFTNVRTGTEPSLGQIREVLSDGSLKIFFRPNRNDA